MNENGEKASLAKHQATKMKTELERIKLKQNTLEYVRETGQQRIRNDSFFLFFFLDNAFYFETKATENHYTTSTTTTTLSKIV